MKISKDSLERAQLTFAELREKERLFAQALAEEREAEEARLRRQIQADMFDLDQVSQPDEAAHEKLSNQPLKK
jgi:hypothetical protein